MEKGRGKVEKGTVSTSWIVFLLVALICVSVAGAVLLRGGEEPGGSGEVLTASTGWGTTHFSNLSAADIEATDDMTVGDDLAVGDDAVIAGYLRMSAATAVSITNGCTLTPTVTYQPLESAGTVGFGDIVTGTAGDRLVLINTSNTSITISDTGSLKLGSNRVLAQYDSLELWSDGTYWVELGYAENASGTTTFSNLATADLTTTDDVVVGDDLSVADFFTLECGGAYSVTNGEDMYGSSSYQELECAAWVTVTLLTMGMEEGQLQIFVNNCANNITIQENADAALAGDFVMGQYDSLMLVFDGARWIELNRSDN